VSWRVELGRDAKKELDRLPAAMQKPRARSALHEVAGKARREEIARMLGGQSESALKHAATLLR